MSITSKQLNKITWILASITVTCAAMLFLFVIFYSPGRKDTSPSSDYLLKQEEANVEYRAALNKLAQEQARQKLSHERGDSLIVAEIRKNRYEIINNKVIKQANENILNISKYQSPELTRAFAELEAENR